jgi:hypothetical protein
MRKIVVSTLLGLGLLLGSAYGEEVIIRTRPPHAIVEMRIARPSRDHVWIGGYHRWDGNAYVWTPGRWELPPRPVLRACRDPTARGLAFFVRGAVECSRPLNTRM